MDWKGVGAWIKGNAGTGAALVGSLLTGNVPGAVAAGVALVSSATGSDDPAQVLQQLQTDPVAMIRLKELAVQDEANIRAHIQEMTRLQLEENQKEHEQTQLTIRGGDAAADREVRMVRPGIAKQSWFGTMAYCIGCFGVHAVDGVDVFSLSLAGILSAPALAYLGLRTGDKIFGKQQVVS